MVLDRTTGTYDITLHLRFDETFTPAVISAIDSLSVRTYQINSNEDVIVSETTNRFFRLALGSNVIQGPFNLEILFDNFAHLVNGRGYTVSVSSNVPIINTIVVNSYHVKIAYQYIILWK